jgi:hypothetical protein
MYNYLFLNDEFAIMVCLLIIFSSLVLVNLLFYVLGNKLLNLLLKNQYFFVISKKKIKLEIVKN